MVNEAWKTLPLGEVITLQRGYDLPHGRRMAGSVPIISSSGRIDTHNVAMVTAPGVVTGRYGTIGEVFYVSEDFWPLNTTLFVSDFKGNEPLFIFYLLQTIDYETYSGKSGVPGVNRNDLHEILVSIPPTPDEQRAIADTLSEVDGRIAALDNAIAKKRDLKQGAMQCLLTGEKRLPGFSGAWEVKPLGKILKYEQPNRYLVDSTDYGEQGIPVLTAGKTFILGFTNETNGIYENLPVIVFDDFTTASRYVDFPFKIKSSAIKLLTLVNEDANLWFISELMQTIRHPVGEHKRYYISEYQHIEVNVPKPEEQKAIATVLYDMSVEIDTLEDEREKTIVLKQGMMQDLLTGKVRLV